MSECDSLKEEEGRLIAPQPPPLHRDELAEGVVTGSESTMFDKIMDDASRLACTVVSPPLATMNRAKKNTPSATEGTLCNARRQVGWWVAFAPLEPHSNWHFEL